MNRIRELRKDRGWLQSDIAARLHTTQQSVARYETGERGLDVETILALCEIFDCTADYLLGRSLMPSPELSDEEAELILAFRSADDRSREIVRLTLDPFTAQDASAERAE